MINLAKGGSWLIGVMLLTGTAANPYQMTLSLFDSGSNQLLVSSGVEDIPEKKWVHLGVTYDHETG